MRVLFVEIDTSRTWSVASLGPGFLGAYIRQFGHEAEMLRVSEDAPVSDLVDAVRERRPDLIGISLTSRQWIGARRLLAGLRDEIDLPVIAGGLHPTFAPDDTLKAHGIDYVCRGEGEKSFLHLVEALDNDIPITDGLIKNIQVTPGETPRLDKPFEPIDDLPWMARDLLDEHHGVINMTTQRGCPFPCTYCAARMYDELYEDSGGNYGRRRSHENVLAEIEHIRDTAEVNYVIFLDDTFTIHHPWVSAFCELYARRCAIPFSIHARLETVNEKMIERLAAAGCRHIVYGVESGSERLRREVMKRPITNENMIRVFEMTRRSGMIVTANYMMGLPGETKEEMRQTLELHHRLEPDDFGYFVFYPYPGTHLYLECRDKGYLPHDLLERPANHRESVLSLPDLTKDDIAAMYDEWTHTRVQDTRRRYDPAYLAQHGDTILREVQSSAAQG